MAILPIVGAVIGLAGSFVAAQGTIAGANSQANIANYQAQVAKIKGSQEAARAQRDSLEARRKEKLLRSGIQARAAASGAGASDPTVVNLMSDVAGRGQYQGALAMWTGQMKQWDYETDATLKNYTADAYRQYGKTAALGTILGGIGSFVGNIAGPVSGFAQGDPKPLQAPSYGSPLSPAGPASALSPWDPKTRPEYFGYSPWS